MLSFRSSLLFCYVLTGVLSDGRNGWSKEAHQNSKNWLKSISKPKTENEIRSKISKVIVEMRTKPSS